jgi:hypothetical protein
MFNPFNKELKLNEINEEILNELISNKVSEGRYIEFKAQLPKNDSVEKTFASFANSDGGYYFVGVEDEKATNIAIEIVGFEPDPSIGFKEKISNIIKNIDPFVNFEHEFVKLKNDKYVYIAKIQRGEDAPYICKNGVIYVRSNEASDPIPEKNRTLLNELFKRRDGLEKRVISFCENDFLEHKARNPYVRINFIRKPYFLFDQKIKDILNAKPKLFFDKVLSIAKSMDGSDLAHPILNYNNLSYTDRSVVFSYYDEYFNKMAFFEVDLFGNARVEFILNEYTFLNKNGAWKCSNIHSHAITSSSHINDYLELIDKFKLNSFIIIEIGAFILKIESFMRFYFKFLNEFWGEVDYSWSGEITNIKEKHIYLNSIEFINNIKEFGFTRPYSNVAKMLSISDKLIESAKTIQNGDDLLITNVRHVLITFLGSLGMMPISNSALNSYFDHIKSVLYSQKKVLNKRLE